MLRSLIPLTIALASAACSPSQGQQAVGNPPAGEGYPARLALTGTELPMELAPLQPAGGQWQAVSADRLDFGLPGQPPLMSVRCERDPSGAALVRLVRVTRAEAGAKALVALIGNGRIARLPLNALSTGEAGQWEGVIRALDPRLDVLNGSSGFEATLPGGGTLMLPASGEPRRLLEACRARDTAAEPAAPAAI